MVAAVSEHSGNYPDADRAAVVPLVPAGARRILDVGCWRGAFGREIKRQRPGTFVVGIEADRSAAAIAAGRLDQVIEGQFPNDVDPSLEPFDCVVFNDVLEHLVDPWNALCATRSLLAPGGAVVSVIPNVRHVRAVVPLVLRGRWDYTDTGLLDRTHLRFFTRATMVELFETTGYTVESIAAQDLSDVGLRGLAMRVLLFPFGKQHSEGLRARHYAIVARVAEGTPRADQPRVDG